ncbi:MAG: hypothetical protein AVDCRST_MAG57-1363, partial [uncultured Blastococcus sp.]
AAARLVLEAALGGRPDPTQLDGADAATLLLASAYADLLQIQQEEALATEWLTALAAADPEDLTGAVDRLGIEFFDDEDEIDLDDQEETDLGGDDAAVEDGDKAEPSTAPEVVELLPEDDHGLGRSFDEDVEAEVAELLGETSSATADDEPNEADEQH